MPTADDSHRQLATGETVIVFLTIALEDRARGVQSLKHRLFTADASIEGAITSAAGVKLLELGPPLQGGPWAAKSGAAKNDSHHRRQFMVLGGSVTLSNRCAIDWARTENDASFKGPEDDIRSYLSYESHVLAVANGQVVAVRDGIPDNKPGHVGAEALKLTLETIVGNFVVLDLGHGEFAYYAHLQPGSLRVKVGQRVKRGEIIALVGNLGSSFEPHLHFEVTTSPVAMRGEGVPYVTRRVHRGVGRHTHATASRAADCRFAHRIQVRRQAASRAGELSRGGSDRMRLAACQKLVATPAARHRPRAAHAPRRRRCVRGHGQVR